MEKNSKGRGFGGKTTSYEHYPSSDGEQTTRSEATPEPVAGAAAQGQQERRRATRSRPAAGNIGVRSERWPSIPRGSLPPMAQ